MKVKRAALANVAYSRFADLIDGCEGLGDSVPDFQYIDEAQFCLDILRQISSGKKRFVIDVEWPK